MIYADFFMISSLTQICCKYIKQFVTPKNVLSVLLVSHAHNCQDLENFCLETLCLNEAEILPSREWKQFKQLTTDSLYRYLMAQILTFKTKNFVQHSMEQFVRENSKVAKKHVYP
jgi:hypothetical protein